MSTFDLQNESQLDFSVFLQNGKKMEQIIDVDTESCLKYYKRNHKEENMAIAKDRKMNIVNHLASELACTRDSNIGINTVQIDSHIEYSNEILTFFEQYFPINLHEKSDSNKELNTFLKNKLSTDFKNLKDNAINEYSTLLGHFLTENRFLLNFLKFENENNKYFEKICGISVDNHDYKKKSDEIKKYNFLTPPRKSQKSDGLRGLTFWTDRNICTRHRSISCIFPDS